MVCVCNWYWFGKKWLNKNEMTKESINTNFRTDIQKNHFVSLKFSIPVLFQDFQSKQRSLIWSVETIKTKIPGKKLYKKANRNCVLFFSINVHSTFCFIDSVNISQNYLVSFCMCLTRQMFLCIYFLHNQNRMLSIH